MSESAPTGAFPARRRPLRPEEARALARCLAEHYPRCRVTGSAVEWDRWLLIESADDRPVVATRLRLDHLDGHRDPPRRGEGLPGPNRPAAGG